MSFNWFEIIAQVLMKAVWECNTLKFNFGFDCVNEIGRVGLFLPCHLSLYQPVTFSLEAVFECVPWQSCCQLFLCSIDNQAVGEHQPFFCRASPVGKVMCMSSSKIQVVLTADLIFLIILRCQSHYGTSLVNRLCRTFWAIINVIIWYANNLVSCN